MDEIADSEINETIEPTIEPTNEPDELNITEASADIASDLFGTKEEPEEIEVEVEEEAEEEAKEEVKDEVKPAPQSWKKEMHEHWNKLDPEVQDYFELREQQMKEGIDVAKDDAALGRDLRDVLTPFDPLLQAQGVDQKTAVQFLLNVHHKLSTSDEQGKLDAINQIAQSHGIKLDGSKVTPEIQTLQQEIGQLKQIIGQSQNESQQEKLAKSMETVNAFASEHEHFDEVADDIVPFLNVGLSLEDAYEKAIWANPVTRQKEQNRLEKERQDTLDAEKQKKLEQAKKAKSANVRTKDTIKAPTGPTGKMFDDFPEILRDIKSR